MLIKDRLEKFIMRLKPKKLWDNLTFEQKKKYIEKYKENMYYIYTYGAYENYSNGIITYDEYVDYIYNDDEFKRFCYTYLEDEYVKL